MEKIARTKALADSGFLYSLINAKDPNHNTSKIAAKKHDRQWITTCFVFREVFVLLNNRKPGFPHLIPNLFNMGKSNLLEIVNFEKSQLISIEDIIKKYSDRKLDLADASLILLAEQHNIGDIFTVDIKDFSVCKWNGKNNFNILK